MAERRVGTVSRGIRCPIIRKGDDLSVIVTDSVLEAAEAEGFAMRDRDVIAITESIVARAQGNYCTVDDIAAEYEGRVEVAKCNVDDNEGIAEKFGVRSIPTLLFFKDGQLAEKTVGLVSKQEIETILNNLL